MKSRISVPQSTSLCIKQNERVKGPNDSVVSVRGTRSLPSLSMVRTITVKDGRKITQNVLGEQKVITTEQ